MADPRAADPQAPRPALDVYHSKPVEFWPTAAIRSAVEGGDLDTWKRIVVALKRDPYGRTARQVEEVLETTSSQGIANALNEVLVRSRADLEAGERAEVSRQVGLLMQRSGLAAPEFASRIGVSSDDLDSYLNGEVSPSASLMIRMYRLAERFAKMRAKHASRTDR